MRALAPREKLSAVVITLNAAPYLERCLVSLGFADEILIVDSGSQDHTVRLARQLGARVIQQDWLGFGPQKRFAVEQAAHRWVICLDADEYLADGVALDIRKALRSKRSSGYRLLRRHRFQGRILRFGEGNGDWVLRLFDREQAQWSEDPVHEKVLCRGPVDKLQSTLFHQPNDALGLYWKKQRHYARIRAHHDLQEGRLPGRTRAFVGLIGSPLWRIVKYSFLRLGLLDGPAGLTHNVLASLGRAAYYLDCLRFGRKRVERTPSESRQLLNITAPEQGSS